MTSHLLENIHSVADARRIFPITESCVYLDSAHYSQFSLETKRRLLKFIEDYTGTNLNLSKFNYVLSDTLREKCAMLIGSEPGEIIISNSTTHGLNIFANGITLNKGDHVAFADTEFPAVVYPWLNQEKLRGIKCVMIPSVNGKIKLEDIEKIIRDHQVKALTISSVGFLGFRNDLAAVNRICKQHNCYFVVDAIQSAGICPINVKELEIDFLSAGSQKWMMSPAGVGFAFISRKIMDKVAPTFVSTNNVQYEFKNFLNYKLNFRDDGGMYDVSTPNTLGMIGMESSIDLFLKLGVENIFKHIIRLQDLLIDRLKDSDYVIESDLDSLHRSNILIFSHRDNSMNEKIQKQLEDKNIFIALREGFLRMSAHIFNNEAEIETLARELKTLE